MLLHHVLRDFYAPLTAISDRTITLYDYTLRAWGEMLGRPAETTDLDELAVARFLAWRVRKWAAATAAKDRAQIHAIWGFCAEETLRHMASCAPCQRPRAGSRGVADRRDADDHVCCRRGARVHRRVPGRCGLEGLVAARL